MKKLITLLGALLTSASLAVETPTVAMSEFYSLDLRDMPRVVSASEIETISYAPAWDGSQTCSVTVSDGTQEDTVVNAADTAGDYTWTVPTVSSPTLWTFTHISANGESLVATYHSTDFTLSVVGGDTIAVTHGTQTSASAPVYSGYEFVKWEVSDGVSLADPTANPAVFTIPDADVVLTPVYQWAPTIELSATALSDSTMSITAIVAPAASPAPEHVKGSTSGSLKLAFERTSGNMVAMSTWAPAPASMSVTTDGAEISGVWDFGTDIGNATLSEATRVYATISANADPVFTNDPKYPWYEDATVLTPSGAPSMRSGTYHKSSTTSTYTCTVTGTGTLSFQWKASGESASYDYLYYSVNGVAQSPKQSGYNSDTSTDINSKSWTQVNVTISDSQLDSNGNATVSWSYRKDGSVDRGSDCGVVGDITWSGQSDIATASCSVAALANPFKNEEADPDTIPEDSPAGTLSQFDVTEVYDGLGHTIDLQGISDLMRDYAKDGATVTYCQSASEPAADSAAWNTTAPQFVAAGTYTVWYKVSCDGCVDYIHPVKVIVEQRPVRIVSRSFTWSQSAGHTAFKMERANILDNTLADGEVLVASDFATHPGLAQGETSKTIQNTFTAKIFKGEVETTSNYLITKITGDLTVVEAHDPDVTPVFGTNPDPDNTTWQPGRKSAFDYWFKYDGQEHTIDVARLEARIDDIIADAQEHGMEGAATATPMYRYAQGTTVGGDEPASEAWSTTAPKFSAAGEYSVWYEVVISSDNVAYRREAVVHIGKREIEVMTGTGVWSYNGQSHSDSYVGISGDPLADGESIDLEAAAPTAQITNVGSVENSLGDVKIWRGEGSDRVETTSNYNITTNAGTLTVTQAANPFTRGQTIDRNTAEGSVSTYDRDVVYSGSAWTIDTEALLSDVADAGYPALVNGSNLVVEYSTDNGETWSETAPGFTNAGEYTLLYRVRDTTGNSASWSHEARVTVAKREVVVHSENARWPWDGQAHSAPVVEINGLCDGDSCSTIGFPSITELGKLSNTFTAELSGPGATKDDEGEYENYVLSLEYGIILIVTPDTTVIRLF